jgi:hypothetical protein
MAGTALAGATPAAAAQDRNFVDLSASVGYSTNAGLSIPSRPSAFGRVSASGYHSSYSERGSTSITGYIENTTYTTGYGSSQIWSLSAAADRAMSPTVTVFGRLDFSGDFAGQLSNRLISVPGEPPVVDPNNPLPPTPTNPDLLGFNGRQYRLSGSGGASIRTGLRGSLSVSAGIQRLIFTGNNNSDDYNTYFGTVGYNHQLSERTSVGALLSVQRQDFTGDSHSTVINPALSVRTQLRQDLVASARVGFMAIEQVNPGETHRSLSPSFSGDLCKSGEQSSFCVSISRDAQSSFGSAFSGGSGQTAINTSASVSYFRRISRNDTFQLSASGTNYSTPNAIDSDKIHSTMISAVAGYDRKIGARLAAGVSVGARKLYRDGADPKSDLNGNIYLRYRIGDLL